MLSRLFHTVVLICVVSISSFAQNNKTTIVNKTLPEVTVKASRILMIVKGDTIEYDAKALRLMEGSMLDNLMRMLPGVRIDGNGRIYVNGEYVSKLMVNGRDFFKDDPNVALNNLPAYVVDKIKTYHEQPEWSHLIDAKNIEIEKRPLVLDVRLKKEYAQGWLANFEVANGSNIHGGWDNRYLARLFGMHYTDHSGVALYGSVNNLGDNQSPGQKGEWKKMDVTQGDRTVKVGGVYVSIDGNKTWTKFNTTLEARREDIVSLTNTTNESHLSTGNLKDRTTDQNQTAQTDLKWEGEIEAKTKRTFFHFEPYVKYLHNHKNGTLTSDEQMNDLESGDIWQQIYQRNLDSRTHEDNWNTGVKIYSKIKSPLSKKNYTITGEANYSHTDENQEQLDNIIRPQISSSSSEHEHRWDALPQMNYYYTFRIERSLIEKYRKNFGCNLGLSYDYAQKYESGERKRERDTIAVDSVLLPSAETEDQRITDVTNSYRTVEMQRKHQIGATFDIGDNNKGKFKFSVSLPVDFVHNSIRDVRNLTTKTLTKREVMLSPNISIRISKLYLMYRLRPQLPSMLDLLDVRNNSNPLFIYRGNSALKKTEEHSFSIMYQNVSTSWQRSVLASMVVDMTDRAIGMARTYDRQTGVNTYQPRNINGNWSFGTNINYGQALDKKGRLMLSTATKFHTDHSVDFANNGITSDVIRSIVDNYKLSEEADLHYRMMNGIYVGVKGKISYLKQVSDRKYFVNNESTDFSYGLTLTAPINSHFGLETDVMTYARRGYTDNSLNTTEWVWNASLSYSFGKDKEWLIRAVGFDILHQLSSIRREVNEQGYTETRYNTIPSYITLHLVYRLNIKPHKR